MSEIGVVHLVHARNGIEALDRFLDSYRRHPAGIGHDLIVACKGFAGGDSLLPVRDRLRPFEHIEIQVPDHGFDIGTYARVSRRLPRRWFCFLNSFSEILGDQWLATLHRHACSPGVGLVGATGSWQSIYANAADRCRIQKVTWRSFLRVLRLPHYKLSFPPFPNAHVRTNGFMMSGDVLSRIRFGSLGTKFAALRFESGWNSLTRQVSALGLAALVVGRDRRSHAVQEWPASRTFRSGAQENLLIADNRTRDFDQADPASRLLLGRTTWGSAFERAVIPAGCA
jgi:hypothetical protein